MELWHFEFLEGGPETPKIGRKSAKIGPLDPSFFFAPAPLSVLAQFFSATALVANGALEKSERLGPF